MTHKWTPGPYRAGHYSSIVGIQITAQPDKKMNTIVLGGVHQSSAPWPREGNAENLTANRAECEATARLWAAAPELFEALEACRKHAAIFTGPGDDVANAVLAMADAALANAQEGEDE